MMEWQVAKQGEDLSSLAEESPPPWRPAGYWRWVVGFLCLLIFVGGLWFRWRLGEGTRAMEADVEELVRFEEQQRFLGLREHGELLMGEDVPEWWAEAYLDTYADPKKRAVVEVEVDKVEFRDTNALVTVRLGGQAQLRAYELVSQEWRRVPLSMQVWGAWRTMTMSDSGIMIHYRARDEGFVEALVAELPILFEQWPVDSELRSIVIQPREFGKETMFGFPQVKREGRRLLVNSPLLVLPSQSVGAEAVVRLALANALLAEANPESEVGLAERSVSPVTGEPVLQNGLRFRAASRAIILVRWALPAEAHADLRQLWQENPGGAWLSPFVTDWPTDRRLIYVHNLWTAQVMERGSFLVADYLYEQIGSEGLLRAVSEVPGAESWDRLFYPLLGRYTVELEEDVQRALGKKESPSKSKEQVPLLPFDGTLVALDPAGESFRLDVPALDQPLSIQATNATLVDPDGKPLPTGCAGLYKELTIKSGDWLELGQEFKASQIAVREISPPLIMPFVADMVLAPSDTLAYSVESEEYQPDNVSSRIHFRALRANGTMTDLGTWPLFLQLISNPQGDSQGRFLLASRLPNCTQAWLLLYDPMRGITNQWLTAPEWRFVPEQMTWHSDQQDLLLFVMNQGPRRSIRLNWQYARLNTERSGLLRPLGELEREASPLGWRATSNQLVLFGRQNRDSVVKVIDLTSQEVAEASPIVTPSTFSILNKDANLLFYMDLGLSNITVPRLLRMLNLETEQEWLIEAQDEGGQEPFWAAYPVRFSDRLLLFNGPIEGNRRVAKRLLLLDPTQPDKLTQLAEVADNEQMGHALACSQNRVLYTVEREAQTEVRVWQPDQATSTLLLTDQPISLWGCPD
ncbi:MAG: hypothetical protein ACPGWR_06700 [Ardenticatenaceae bacterium]